MRELSEAEAAKLDSELASLLRRLARQGIPMVDYHVHLRGGVTVEKAVER